MRRTSCCIVMTGLLAISSAGAEEASPDVSNVWNGSAEGAWVEFDWSERWGTNPGSSEKRRTIVTGHRANGTSTTETQRLEPTGSWKRVFGGLHGAYPPSAEGMQLKAEATESIRVAGLPRTCTRRDYEHSADDGSGETLTLWHCSGLDLAPRVLPQWSVSFGWQLAPDVGRALIERRDAKGAATSVELQLDAVRDSVATARHSIDCFREVLTWTHRMPGQTTGRVTGKVTRWMSSGVPGLLVKRIHDNRIGKIETTQLTDFGEGQSAH
ncbi:MAG: hypothetical protein GY716_22200 [bacterium]|nr:hypothetical protein [bacterium]